MGQLNKTLEVLLERGYQLGQLSAPVVYVLNEVVVFATNIVMYDVTWHWRILELTQEILYLRKRFIW